MATFRSYNLADLTYVDVGEYLKEKDTILVPMASTEQHGPHLPLKTDTFTAEEVARRISEQTANFAHARHLGGLLAPAHVRTRHGTRDNHAPRRNAVECDVRCGAVVHSSWF